MRPQPRSVMPSHMGFVMSKTESRLVRMTAPQSTLSSFLKTVSRVMPALLTGISMGPLQPGFTCDKCDLIRHFRYPIIE